MDHGDLPSSYIEVQLLRSFSVTQINTPGMHQIHIVQDLKKNEYAVYHHELLKHIEPGKLQLYIRESTPTFRQHKSVRGQSEWY